jgi:hypothetical protein
MKVYSDADAHGISIILSRAGEALAP